jgi:hypothetical protein
VLGELNSSTAVVTTVRASTSVLVGGKTLIRATNDSKADDSVDASKTWVDANIAIDPLTASPSAGGVGQVLTVSVNVDDGSGFANAPSGTVISFQIVSGPGSLDNPSCTVSDGSGSCSVTLNSGRAGVTDVNASTSVLVGGKTLNRSTGDTNAGYSPDASISWQ